MSTTSYTNTIGKTIYSTKNCAYQNFCIYQVLRSGTEISNNSSITIIEGVIYTITIIHKRCKGCVTSAKNKNKK